MKTKKIYKLGLSLLIALAFIIPSGTIMADADGESEAGDYSNFRSDPTPLEVDPCEIEIKGLVDIEPGLIRPDCYDLILRLEADPQCECPPPMIKAFVEIYQIGCGVDVVMYETSFEDNFDIYNNWIQIDADCGEIGGHYDSWTWSDARASDGDHSFKSTMYDIYKGNQEDYLQCLKSFDCSDQYAVNVSFDIYVDGDGAEVFGWGNPYSMWDYLNFEVSDNIFSEEDIWFNPGVTGDLPANPGDVMRYFDSTGWFYDPEGSYNFFSTFLSPYDTQAHQNYLFKVRDLGGGWWHVWWEAPIALLENWEGPQLNTSDLMFRFSWHTDPQFQFEGAYVDNFKVVSVEDVETKIFQSHSQGADLLTDLYFDGIYYYFQYPLEWCAEFIEQCGSKETQYDIKLWIEVLDDEGCWWTENDMPPFGLGPVEIEVLVADWFDIEVGDITIETSFEADPIIPGSGVMTAGDDAHIMSEIHVGGSMPATDIPVEAYAQKKTWEIIYETGFEDNPPLVKTGNWHITDFDSFTGDKSLAFFNPETRHYENNEDYEYAKLGPMMDMSEYEQVYLDFYCKYITEWFGDSWGIVFEDPATNFHLSMRPYGLASGDEWRAPPWETWGFHPAWRGPMQPMGEYESFDVTAMYELWKELKGQFRNDDGSVSYQLKVGFLFHRSDGDTYTHPMAEDHDIYWSGLMIDDVTIRGLKIEDEKVWQDTIIIPGPVEPCEYVDVQFEWEDVPYSNYKITIESTPGCGNLEDTEESVQILVVSDKERADEKEVESIDLSGFGGGEWGICTSDTDNYLSTNNRANPYDANMFMAAQLLVDGDACINISHIDMVTPDPNALLLEFDAWFDIELNWDYAWIQVSPVCPPDDLFTDWTVVQLGTFPDYYAYGFYNWFMSGASDTNYILGIGPFTADEDGFIHYGPIDLKDFLPTGITEFAFRFVFMSDTGYETYRGVLIDNVVITDLIWDDEFPPEAVDFEDTMDDMDNWESVTMHSGQFWEYEGDNEWCTFFPTYDYYGSPYFLVLPIQDALVWTTEIMDCYEAYLTIETLYDFGSGLTPKGEVQISSDGGDNWYVLDVFQGMSPDFDDYTTYSYDLTFWAGESILIRFLAESGMGGIFYGHYGDGYGLWCVKDMMITGKQDHTAPTSSITMTGTMSDAGYYSSAVQCSITAFDDASGIKEIHYILDGTEHIITGDTATFTVSTNGAHNIEYWCVDQVGNVEAHHTVPTFRIDSGSPPTVSITAPEPGLYLFGNKILSLSKVFIIGAFTIDATATDADSGVYRVQFYLDGDIISEDTAAPYSAYCAVKHMGEGTIRVVAEDFAGNSAEDTLDITYYKFL